MNEADALASGKHENKKSLSAYRAKSCRPRKTPGEIAVKHIDEERAESERSAGAGREASAKARASEADRRISTRKPPPPKPFAIAM